jgi:RNA polymerase sigma-70 factor, ECF subfamily
MPDSDLAASFSRLLIANQRRLYGFVYTLVQDHTATDEILQEVATVLWKKFDQFEPGTDFGAWAMKVSRFTVFEWRRKQAKLPLPMGEELFASIADKAVEVSCDLEGRLDALQGCVRHLNARDQALVADRYEEDLSVVEIAQRSGRTRGAVYKILTRIHRDLLGCVKDNLSHESLA